ncbi:hypothetical protein [Flavobacterium cellulosilyticum]|uniref:hypothetical protein n=1 Tax=Flavobacterium cellulosilyticum TaxID=2541731 RepID=UPI001FE523F4|nr:hypothetical protein [Flavobacterium cellulosilyticum]
MNIIKRAKAPTPKFFKVLRNIGLALAAIGGTILAAPVRLPVGVTTVGGYLAVAGGIASAVSQLTTGEEVSADISGTSAYQEGLRPFAKLGAGSAQPDTVSEDDSG